MAGVRVAPRSDLGPQVAAALVLERGEDCPAALAGVEVEDHGADAVGKAPVDVHMQADVEVVGRRAPRGLARGRLSATRLVAGVVELQERVHLLVVHRDADERGDAVLHGLEDALALLVLLGGVQPRGGHAPQRWPRAALLPLPARLRLLHLLRLLVVLPGSPEAQLHEEPALLRGREVRQPSAERRLAQEERRRRHRSGGRGGLWPVRCSLRGGGGLRANNEIRSLNINFQNPNQSTNHGFSSKTYFQYTIGVIQWNSYTSNTLISYEFC